MNWYAKDLDSLDSQWRSASSLRQFLREVSERTVELEQRAWKGERGGGERGVKESRGGKCGGWRGANAEMKCAGEEVCREENLEGGECGG